jgi:oxygen-independent coproporphyrinogen III oxidase
MRIGNGIEDVGELHHLYVHIPFCPKICPYCSFYKEATDRNKTQAFLDAILLELDRRLKEIRCCRIYTIFFGGGTPSALSVKQLEFLLAGIHRRIDLSHLREWTLEMNPATVSLEKAIMLRELGINRVSMGVQSWDPEMLARLGRVHSAQQAERSFHILRKAGFTNVNLDLIFGIPGQSADVWEKSLSRTIGLGPEHISAYSLTFEEDTEYFLRYQRGEFQKDTERDAHYFERAMAILENAGFSQYEISNFAKPGYDCLHNLAYWQGHAYLGLGPSAFSTFGGKRWQNTPDTKLYIQQIQAGLEPVGFQEDITAQIRRAESIAFGLRTAEGVPEAVLEPWTVELEELRREGYLETENTRIRLTRKGRLVADSIAELFI